MLIQNTFPDGSVTETEYDAAGRTVETTDELGNTATRMYDAAGRVVSQVDALGFTTTYEYDGNGNRIRVTDANGHITEFDYDSNDRLISTFYHDGTTSTTSYDALGRRISETDQAGNVTQFAYDALGRLISVTDALGNLSTYTYDEVGNKLTQTDANVNTTYLEYDNLGREIRRTLPLGMSDSTAYDAAGNITAYTDFNGATTTFDYDVNGRMTSKHFADGTSETYTYTATGQRQTITDSRGVTAYSYDLRDRLLQRTDPDGTTIFYEYDAAGNRTTVIIPSGRTDYTYDALNRLETVTDPHGGVTTYSYDAVGNRASVTYPNSTIAEYTYDALSRLTDLVNRKSGGEIISSYAYTLGPAGNRTGVVENTGRTVDYAYDATYKLTQESINDPVTGSQVISYTYDAVGNRLTKNVDGAVTNHTYDPNDRLLTENGTTYTYDDNGNTLSKASATEAISYGYDYQNRLIDMIDGVGGSQAEFVYDVDGIRVQKTVDGTDITNYLVDKNRDYAQVLEERNDVGSLEVSYVHGDDLISQQRGGVTSYYHYDGQMSTRALTEATEAATDNYVYDAFGILLTSTGATENDYLYTGEQYDPNLGFYYLRSRYYDYVIGRFVTPDPFHGSKYDPASLHKYSYCSGDPMNKLDPSGLFALASLSVRVAVTAVLISIALPAVNSVFAAFGAYGARTDHFELELGLGIAGFKKIGGGLMSARISELSPTSGRGLQGGAQSREYGVTLFGIGIGGVGVSADAIWELPIRKDFYSATPRSLSAFIGIGNVTSVGYTPHTAGLPHPSVTGGIAGPFVAAYIGLILPDFTPINRIGVYFGGGSVGHFAFTAMALWL
jgi:RHS repeat-associated protein